MFWGGSECGEPSRALGGMDRVEVNLNLISMTIVVMMMELVRVEAMRLP